MRKTFKRRFMESTDAILDRYLPASGEGENMAEQAVTAVNKIEFGWYNDGDVFDNTYQLEGWANDLSCYANWLHHYVPGAAEVLAGIKNISSDAEYAALVQELKRVVYNESLLGQLEAEAALDSIYECDGPYKFEDCTCPECGISCSQAELDEYGSCYDCYERAEDSYDDDYDFEESYSRKSQLRRVKESSARRQPKARRLRESEDLMLRARELADEYVMSTPGGPLYQYYCLVDLNNSARTPRLHGYRDNELMERYQLRSFARSCGILDSYPGSSNMAEWVAEIDRAGNPNNVFALWTSEALYPTEYGKQNIDKFLQALENSIKYQHKRYDASKNLMYCRNTDMDA